MSQLIPAEVIEQRILLIRGQKVMLDRDLAKLYGVPTMRLNEAVKRNIKRFPSDFMFQLSIEENNHLISQIAMSKRRGGHRRLPFVFTEQGVAMLSSVLRSERAIDVNIAIMRAFVKVRGILSTHKDLVKKLIAISKILLSVIARNPNIFIVRVTKRSVRWVCAIFYPTHRLRRQPFGFAQGRLVPTGLLSQRDHFVPGNDNFWFLTSLQEDLERKYESHDKHIKIVFDAIRQLMAEPKKKKYKVGF